MSHALWLIPMLPFAGFLALALFRPGDRLAAWIGAGSVGGSAILSAALGATLLLSPPPGYAFTRVYWTWIDAGSFRPEISFRFDALSMVMVWVITGVGFLIHLYSVEHMRGEEGVGRFFAYMNLFVGSMLTLVLAGNLLLLYLGWEGVGLCSYLLIGFWYKDEANGRAARKAFIVTRFGDAALAIGLFLLFTHLGTLEIQEVMERAVAQWQPGTGLAVAAAALLLAGAVGKSAQLPLQTWLPDAMAGPSPVSALIHAATMVTAGVYLIARTHVLFALAPVVQTAVAVIGAVTLLLAGCSALTQWDIKRVLAYSTISQIGYMFLALGVGAWSAALFHFMTHAFFKALLFLGAGVVIHALDDEHNLFKMGGLRRQLPGTFVTFLIASASLAAVPLVTAGFYSKDLILWSAWSSEGGGAWLWGAGVLGAFITSLYTFRMVFLAFFGPPAGAEIVRRPGLCIQIPLGVLAVLSLAGGWVELPVGRLHLFSDLLSTVLPATAETQGAAPWQFPIAVFTALVSLGGIGLAYVVFLRRPAVGKALAGTALGSFLHRWGFRGWGFDGLYDALLVRPYAWMARIDRNDFVDLFFGALARGSRLLHEGLSDLQTGRMRWYAMGIGFGAALVLGMVIWL